MKPVVTDKYEFEYRGEASLKAILNSLGHRDPGAKTTICELNQNLLYKFCFFLNGTLMEDIKGLVAMQNEIGYRSENLVVIFFLKLGPSRFDARKK